MKSDIAQRLQAEFPNNKIDFYQTVGPLDFAPRWGIKVDGEKAKVCWTHNFDLPDSDITKYTGSMDEIVFQEIKHQIQNFIKDRAKSKRAEALITKWKPILTFEDETCQQVYCAKYIQCAEELETLEKWYKKGRVTNMPERIRQIKAKYEMPETLKPSASPVENSIGTRYINQ